MVAVTIAYTKVFAFAVAYELYAEIFALVMPNEEPLLVCEEVLYFSTGYAKIFL